MSESATASVDTGTESTDGGNAGEGGNAYAEQIASIENRLGQLDTKLDERLPVEQEEQAGFTDQLYGYEPEYDESEYDDGGEIEYDEDYEDELSGEEIVEQMIAERMAPLQEAMLAREQQEAFAQIDQLQEKYPDLKTDPQVQRAVVETVQRLVGPDGNPLDPNVVEIAYKAVKADAAAAQEVPAESAVQDQAFLETGAGSSHQGDNDPDDEIRKAIMRHSVGGDPF